MHAAACISVITIPNPSAGPQARACRQEHRRHPNLAVDSAQRGSGVGTRDQVQRQREALCREACEPGAPGLAITPSIGPWTSMTGTSHASPVYSCVPPSAPVLPMLGSTPRSNMHKSVHPSQHPHRRIHPPRLRQTLVALGLKIADRAQVSQSTLLDEAAIKPASEPSSHTSYHHASSSHAPTPHAPTPHAPSTNFTSPP